MASAPHRRSRVMHAFLMLPALAVGVLLLAVGIADRTGTSLGDLLDGPDAVVDLVPAAFTDDKQ